MSSLLDQLTRRLNSDEPLTKDEKSKLTELLQESKVQTSSQISTVEMNDDGKVEVENNNQMIESERKNETSAGEEKHAKLVLNEETMISTEKHENVDEDFIPKRYFEGDVRKLYKEDKNLLIMLNFRISELPDLTPLKGCKISKINLRQNFLPNLNGLEMLGEHIEELDCYLNTFGNIPVCTEFPNLRWLDLSFNAIRKITNLETCSPKLKDLFLINNKIRKIENVNMLTNLDQIEFGGNRIRKIENLEGLNITKLWLGKNKIRRLEGVSSLQNLRILSLQSNRIEVIEGLDGLTSLEELYLGQNGIKRISGLENTVNITTLDISGNQITKLENLESLKKLESLWLNDNQIDTWDGLNCITSNKLETLYLERNPIQSSQNYRQRIVHAFPTLIQLDAQTLQRRLHLKEKEMEDEDID